MPETVEATAADQHAAEIARFRECAREMQVTLREMSEANEILRTQNRALNAKIADMEGRTPYLPASREAAYLYYIETLKTGKGVTAVQAKVTNLRNVLIEHRTTLQEQVDGLGWVQRFVLRLVGVDIAASATKAIQNIDEALNPDLEEDF